MAPNRGLIAYTPSRATNVPRYKKIPNLLKLQVYSFLENEEGNRMDKYND